MLGSTCISVCSVFTCSTCVRLLFSEVMLRELIRETLRCCTRDELERIQLDSSVLDELIVAGSGVLPLRTICVVDMVR